MKINTILAVCLFSLSGLAMAGNGDCCSKHNMSTAAHAMSGDKTNSACTKTCKHHNDDAKAMAGMSKAEHMKMMAGMKHGDDAKAMAGMSKAEHMKMMADTCKTDDCMAECDSDEAEGMDAKCQEHCDAMKKAHTGH